MIQKYPEGTLRLFTGIALPPDVTSWLDDLVRRLKPLAPLRWSPASNFHITTKFIGAWPEDRLDSMKQALAPLQGSGPLPIAVRGLGFYPNVRSPHVFWAGVEGGASLPELASRTDAACAALGVKREEKKYSPHLTLARIDQVAGLEPLHQALVSESAAFGEFVADRFHLYLSRPGQRGTLYTSLAEFPL